MNTLASQSATQSSNSLSEQLPSTDSDTSSRVLQALDKAKSQIESLQRHIYEPIAVIGMSCRFPGADTPEAFWDILREGRHIVMDIPADRWNADDYYDPRPNVAGKMCVRRGSFIKNIDQFDPHFFDISPREAKRLDPQQRLMLEVSWEALERAGQSPEQLVDSQTGVFVGINEHGYAYLEEESNDPDIHFILGNGHCMDSGRLSYILGLQGPNLALDTACSSSLVAVHLACQSLRNRECEIALASSAILMLVPDSTIGLSVMGVISPEGWCKTFDAAADGYGRGEGCGVVVLKRYSDAVRDCDNILAVIRGSAINHDGRGSGLTVPNKLAQEALLRKALKAARIAPQDVSYIEAHGTGTVVGDPLEVSALATVFNTERQSDLWIGSVKPNIGHLEPTAGIAGLMKVVLMLQHQQIPANLGFNTPNPYIDWDNLPIQVPTQLMPWDAPERIAGVSSFGISGTNAHVILSEVPKKLSSKVSISKGDRHHDQPVTTRDDEQTTSTAPVEERPWHIITLSAKTKSALKALAQRYQVYLQDKPDARQILGHIAYTANVGRSHFSHRLSITAESAAAMQAKLTSFITAEPVRGVNQNQLSSQRHVPEVAFLFTGQGAQYVDMGRELYATHPTFRQYLDDCDKLLRPYLHPPLLDIMFAHNMTPDEAQKQLNQTRYTQPALFALEYALAKIWQSWGIEPDMVLGHSVGEIVAACLAGVFSLEDALKLVAVRGRLIDALPQEGEMVSVQADEARVQQAIARYHNEVSIAAINGLDSLVVSGKRDRVRAIAEQFVAQGVKTRKLTVSHAFHSPLMEPMLDEFKQVAASITYHKPKLPLISNITGQQVGDEVMTSAYWVRHVREAVRFSDGIASLAKAGATIFIEIGPQPTLLGMAQRVLMDSSANGSSVPIRYLPSLRPNLSDWQQMLESLGELYVEGIVIDWEAFDQPYQRRKVVLPTYPFQRQRYWLDIAEKKPENKNLRPLIDSMITLPRHNETVFEKTIHINSLPFLENYRTEDKWVFSLTAQLSMLASAAELYHEKWYQEKASFYIRNLDFSKPLHLTDDINRTAHVTITPASAEQVNFELMSFVESKPNTKNGHNTNSVATEEKIQTHVMGQLCFEKLQQPVLAIDEWQAECQTACDITIFSQLWRSSSQWLQSVWLGEGMALCKIERPERIRTLDDHIIYPELLEACCHLAGIMQHLHSNNLSKYSGMQLAGVTEVKCYQAATGRSWWAAAEQNENKRWDIKLLDETGHILIELGGVEISLTSSLEPTAITTATADQPKILHSQSIGQQTLTAIEQRVQHYVQQALINILDLTSPNELDLALDLQSYGIDSFMLTQLYNQLRSTLQIDLPMASLLESSSLNELQSTVLSYALQQLINHKHSSLVCLKEGQDRLPLFLLLGAGGEPVYFYQLAKHLHPNQPVYVLSTPVSTDDSPSFMTIEALATHYLQLIQQLQTEGPYFLVGHSAGGYTAFEMAQQLIKRDQTVGLLGILDIAAPSEPHNDNPSWTQTDYMIAYAQRIEGLREQLNDLRTTLQVLKPDEQLVAFKTALEQAKFLLPTVELTTLQQLLEQFQADVQRFSNYIPQNPISIPITLFKAEESYQQTADNILAPYLTVQESGGWERFGQTTVLIVPGNHYTMVSEKPTMVLSEILGIYLNPK